MQQYIAVSQDLEKWLLETVGVSPAKVRQIYNGVDQEKFRPPSGARPEVTPPGSLPADALVVGTVGRLAGVKNQLSLLRSTRLLCDRQPELGKRLRVILVGDGPMEAAVRRAVADLGLTQQVWLAGDRQDVSRLLQSMDVFVLPSLGEGISNTVLEAMATGVPVIATRVGGNPELIENGRNGRLVTVDDDRALGFVVRAARMVRLTRAQAEAFYAVHRERPFFGPLCTFMRRGRAFRWSWHARGQ